MSPHHHSKAPGVLSMYTALWSPAASPSYLQTLAQTLCCTYPPSSASSSRQALPSVGEVSLSEPTSQGTP